VGHSTSIQPAWAIAQTSYGTLIDFVLFHFLSEFTKKPLAPVRSGIFIRGGNENCTPPALISPTPSALHICMYFHPLLLSWNYFICGVVRCRGSTLTSHWRLLNCAACVSFYYIHPHLSEVLEVLYLLCRCKWGVFYQPLLASTYPKTLHVWCCHPELILLYL